ncbi:hypothetical protein F2Q70_00034975 [Brassica cretica]|uniref:Bet v I/Major latex protein domain-containing protein n=1 Tax=Brassica cretica TaxID=69181 RepID=A0A8S9JRU3_BRACR|nr:hypothetical protein F2Q70_00034975 [Brassica cretica]KAF3532378.1 hypothetical protein DY000_02038061 [Brassica cretica]
MEKQEVFKERREIDDEKKTVTFRGLEGHVMEQLKVYEANFQFIPKSEDGSVCKITFNWEKRNDDFLDPSNYMKFIKSLAADMDDHHHSPYATSHHFCGSAFNFFPSHELFVGLLKFWSKAGRVSSSLPEASTSQDASNFGDSFWLLDPSLPTTRLLFLSPSSILLYVKVVYSFISLSTFLLEFFLRLTLQLPSRKSGAPLADSAVTEELLSPLVASSAFGDSRNINKNGEFMG